MNVSSCFLPASFQEKLPRQELAVEPATSAASKPLVVEKALEKAPEEKPLDSTREESQFEGTV